MPDDASIVQPVTGEEKAATRSFLTWVAEVVGVAGENTDRAERAKQHGC